MPATNKNSGGKTDKGKKPVNPIRPIEVSGDPRRIHADSRLTPRQQKVINKSKKEESKITAVLDEGIDDGKFFDYEVETVRKWKQDAFLGYLSMDVVQPPPGAIWGKFNNRSVNESWVKALAAAFGKNIDNCSNDYSMDLALDPKWLIDPTVILASVDGLKIHQVPVVNFNELGLLSIKNDNLWMLGGNHRRIALTRYITKMTSELVEMKAAIKEETAGKTEEDIAKMDSECASTLKEAHNRIQMLEEKIESSCMWTVRVYDRGAFRDCPFARCPPIDRTTFQPR